MADGVIPVDDLSLGGLFDRLDRAEQSRELRKPSEEAEAILASEGDAKKAVASRLSELNGSGLTAAERERARSFLEAQLRSADADSSRAATARRTKLQELLATVQAAPSAEEPAHVKRARADLAKMEKTFADVQKNYERWEKGKVLLGMEEMKELKKAHADGQKRLEAAKENVDRQLLLRPGAAGAGPSAAARPAAAAAGGGGGWAKAGSKPARASAGPAVHTAGALAAPSARTGGGYPAAVRQAPRAQPVAPSPAAWASAPATPAAVAAAAAPSAPSAGARQRRSPAVQEEENEPVLSFACTCQAVSELKGVSKEVASSLAGSSIEFREHLSPEEWAQVRDRSLAIEREQREKQREAEKRKQAAALARVTDKQDKERGGPGAKAAPKAPVGGRSVPGAAAVPAPAGAGAGAAKAKAKAASKQASGPPRAKQGGASLQALGHRNRFGGLDDDSD